MLTHSRSFTCTFYLLCFKSPTVPILGFVLAKLLVRLSSTKNTFPAACLPANTLQYCKTRESHVWSRIVARYLVGMMMPLRGFQVVGCLRRSQTIIRSVSRSQVTASAEQLEAAKPASALPQPSGKWPIIGHLPIMISKKTQQRMHHAFDDMRKECGDIYAFYHFACNRYTLC